MVYPELIEIFLSTVEPQLSGLIETRENSLDNPRVPKLDRLFLVEFLALN